MTIKPAKFTLGKSVAIDGHEVGAGVYVGQKISDTEVERSHRRKASYFLHFATQGVEGNMSAVQRFDLDVTDLVKRGEVTVS